MRGRLETRTKKFDPNPFTPAHYAESCDYDCFIPDPLVGFDEPIDAATLDYVAEAEDLVANLNTFATPSLEPLARLLLRTESIASSKVEGLAMDARELARAESKADTGREPGALATEILGNIDAMSLAVERAGEQRPHFGVGDIIAIHSALLAGTASADLGGQIRTVQNWIGGNNHNPCGAAYVPPPPEYVPELLVDLCASVEETHLPALVQAALVHAQFESIHPFADGNGRTGRALIHVVLKRRGLTPAYVPPISVQLAKRKESYIAALTAFRSGDSETWIRLFAEATADAAALARTYLTDVRRLQDLWAAVVREKEDPGNNSVVWRLIEILPSHPVITAATAAAAIGRPRPVVNDALHVLDRAGVLTTIAGGRRNRLWEASSLLDLLTGLEQGRARTL